MNECEYKTIDDLWAKFMTFLSQFEAALINELSDDSNILENEEFQSEFKRIETNEDRFRFVFDRPEIRDFLRQHLERTMDRLNNSRRIGLMENNYNRTETTGEVLDVGNVNPIAENMNDIQRLNADGKWENIAPAITSLSRISKLSIYKNRLHTEDGETLSLRCSECILLTGFVAKTITESNEKIPNSVKGIKIEQRNADITFKAEQLFERYDLLFIDSPFSFVFLKEEAKHHCYHCMSEFTAEKKVKHHACLGCKSANFCSIECQEIAWSQYHQYECSFMCELQKWPVVHLAFRILMRVGIDEALKIAKSMPEANVTRTIPRFDLKPNSYKTILQLKDHSRDFNPRTNFMITLITIYFMLYLSEEASFIEVESVEFFTIGGLIIRHIQQLFTCSMQIRGALYFNRSTPCAKVMADLLDFRNPLGIGIYPIVSWIKHSCSPNAKIFFDGVNVVVRAIRNIREDDEITICYLGSMDHQHEETNKRKHYLSSVYRFICVCEGCKGELVNEHSKLVCPKCKGPVTTNDVFERNAQCLFCKSINEMDVKKITEYVSTVLGQLPRSINVGLSDIIDTLMQIENVDKCLMTAYYFPYNCNLYRLKNILISCYIKKQAYFDASRHLECVSKVTQALFGECSLEYALQLCDLIEVELNSLRSLHFWQMWQKFDVREKVFLHIELAVALLQKLERQLCNDPICSKLKCILIHLNKRQQMLVFPRFILEFFVPLFIRQFIS
ncbi:SET and MYND domain-containing protein (SMYD)-like protein [Dinothrombium tinctorium]|uniref:SET and MYND domain-containing protein (SMYD)-like protein n=1 Tax=Dinothrombium tinctorium TaxID=1965070 RepID=A0A3S3PA73_9ACAR|nr:SET and MYND domain-containing protein (SMYD)-like protein [Dinothrombium tinctorium]RWS15520.1 SET and MYND domain-containing protein (SMYD)-like protein [Dinothrombium tinctorium]RWS15534.1 SET and MYND domain-containing protein (SMYD)-like protein [Dinothrombium tinctorium]